MKHHQYKKTPVIMFILKLLKKKPNPKPKVYFCNVIDDSDFWNFLLKSSQSIMANKDEKLLLEIQNEWKNFYKISV